MSNPVLIDNADLDLITATSFVNGDGYLFVRRHGRLVRAHRIIVGRMLGRELRADEQVDHINRNPSDNRRSNLRVCNHSQNMFNRGRNRNNTTGYKGVYRNSAGARRPWQARITENGKLQYLGSYDTPEEAARAYDRAARRLAGEFAQLNND